MRYRHSWIVEPIGLEVRNLPKPITGKSLFGNEQPLEMEIGTGKGTFLADEAKRRPTVNFIGVERARRYWRLSSDRLRRHERLNVRLILADADYFLTEFVPQDCLTVVYVHFPDPWPKKRHHKRRLLQPAFLEEVERVLTPGGRFQVVTDHRDYYEHIEEAVASSSLIMSEYDRPATAVSGELVGSNFERKYRREGRVSYAVAAVKARTSSQLGRTTTVIRSGPAQDRIRRRPRD